MLTFFLYPNPEVDIDAVSAKYGEKTTTIGHLVKGEVIQFDYPYVPPGSIIAFSVKLGMYSNIKYAKTTSDLKIIINVELGRHFLVLKFDKSVFVANIPNSSERNQCANACLILEICTVGVQHGLC